MMWNRAFAITVRAVLPIAVALGAGISSHAGEGKWTLQLEPMYVEAYGHDQHVLTVHEIDFGPPQSNDMTAITLDTEGSFQLRGELRYTRKQWSWGMDVSWYAASQDTETLSAAADGPSGPIDEVIFQAADREYTSSDPSEVLYYRVRPDTDLAAWTVDFYAMRTLGGSSDGGIHLQFGLRMGDFDNDYRAVVGIENVEGSKLDASSNYGRMMGPLVALAGNTNIGRNSIEGYIGQSLILGDATLKGTSNEFTGPFTADPSFVALESFRTDQELAIPITEFRLKWVYRVSKTVALGVGANTSVWWDVSVPPGVIPVDGGNAVLHENTIVFFGLAGIVKLTF